MRMTGSSALTGADRRQEPEEGCGSSESATNGFTHGYPAGARGPAAPVESAPHASRPAPPRTSHGLPRRRRAPLLTLVSSLSHENMVSVFLSCLSPPLPIGVNVHQFLSDDN